MATEWAEKNGHRFLENDTVINVAGLLKEDTGSKRTYDLRLTNFPLADDVIAPRLEAHVQLTKLPAQIVVDGEMEGTAVLECVRCLRPYLQDFESVFSEPYLQTVDVRSGVALHDSLLEDDDEDRLTINANHELDLSEALRQNALLALPMRPDCGEFCPGPDLAALERANADDAEAEDNRFAALSSLLIDENDSSGR